MPPEINVHQQQRPNNQGQDHQYVRHKGDGLRHPDAKLRQPVAQDGWQGGLPGMFTRAGIYAGLQCIDESWLVCDWHCSGLA